MISVRHFSLVGLAVAVLNAAVLGAASPSSITELATTRMNAAADVIDAKLDQVVSATNNRLDALHAKSASPTALQRVADAGKAQAEKRALTVRAAVIKASQAGVAQLTKVRKAANRKGDTATVSECDADIASLVAFRESLTGDNGTINTKATAAKAAIDAHLAGLGG